MAVKGILERLQEQSAKVRAAVEQVRDDPELANTARTVNQAMEEARWEGLGPWDQARYVTAQLSDVVAQQVKAALLGLATHIEGATPRVYGFEHPCDPPGARAVPTAAELERMKLADFIRELAEPDQSPPSGETL